MASTPSFKLIEFKPDEDDLKVARILLDLAWEEAQTSSPVGIAILMVGGRSSWMVGSTKDGIARERLLGLTAAWERSLADGVIEDVDEPEVERD